MEDFPIKNWIPYELINQDGEWLCKWLNTFQKPFTKPFFGETILELKAERPNHYFTSSSNLAMMKGWAADIKAIPPSAFIFHTSRCGSTLISQLLSTSNKNIVLPEVPFFDNILRLTYQDENFTAGEILSLLEISVKYYGQARMTSEQRVYIKADSWHMFFYHQLRNLYPDLPFILMYRNPAEILNSLKKVPGLQSVPGLIEPAIFGFELTEPIEPDTYISMLLDAYLQQYLTIIAQENNFLLLNYNEGPMPMIMKIADFTNIPLSDTEIAAMAERSQYHSKKPGDVFSEKMPAYVTPCLNKAMELYHQLEEIRVYNLI